jgi:hypothetical protein
MLSFPPFFLFPENVTNSFSFYILLITEVEKRNSSTFSQTVFLTFSIAITVQLAIGVTHHPRHIS